MENCSFSTTHKSSVSIGFTGQIMHILRILCYNGSLVTWTTVSLTATKFKPLISSVSGLSLSYTANMFILMFLYDFSLLLAQFYYIIAYIRKFESRVQIAERCSPWNFQRCKEPCFADEMTERLSTLQAGRPLPPGRFLVLISVRGWVNPRSIMRLEGLGQLKNLMTSSGIEPATFRLVA
jgi:hypothetical protein